MRLKRFETARLVPSGAGHAPYSLHVVLGAQTGELFQPVPLVSSREEGTARVFLGAIFGEEDSLVEMTAVKILPNSLLSEERAIASALTNRLAWERWERERLRFKALRNGSTFFPRLVQPAVEAGVREGEIPPLLFCSEHKCFFPPLCPYCGQHLRTLRSEDSLRQRRLPPFSDSYYRFLVCEACADKSGAVALFTATPLPPEVPIKAGGPQDLIESTARSLLRDWDEPALSRFLCTECADTARRARKEGNAPNPVHFSERFSAFNLCDSPLLVTGLSPARWDEWSDIVGGRASQQMAPPGAPDPLMAITARTRIEWLGEKLPPGNRLFFGHEATGLDAVETLCLKLTGFRQVLEAVLSYYRITAQPHLDIHSGHVLFDTFGAMSALPALWTFEARLHGVASATSTSAFGFDVVIPPVHPTYPYAAPEIVEFQLAASRPADLHLTDVIPDGGPDGGMVKLQGKISDPNGLYPKPSPPDPVRVAVPEATLNIGVAALTVYLREHTVPGYQEFEFVSGAIRMDEPTLRRLRRTLINVRIPGVRYKVYPRFGSPSDLYSLGVLLLRGLSGDGEGSFIARVQGLARAGGLLEKGNTKASPVDQLKAAAGHEPLIKSLLDKSSVFFRTEDRLPGRPNAIPQPMWDRIVTLAYRMLVRIPGFSICANPADFNPDDPTERIERLLDEVNEMVASLRAMLFHRQPIHREISQVLAEILLEEAGSGEAKGRT